MSLSLSIFSVVAIIFSVIIHEYMHGFMADEEGDGTAREAGRLTLNPLVHIDPWGSVALPILLFLMTNGSFIFGYAKPVPFNPLRLRDPKWSPLKVALAGPLSNLAVALFFGFCLRFFNLGQTSSLSAAFQIIVQINLLLCVFNLLPIPPLDGSRVLFPFLPPAWQEKMIRLEPYGIVFALFVVFFAFSLVLALVDFLFKLIVGW